MRSMHRAPVAATSERLIAAPPEDVWRVLTAIDAWPAWNPAIQRATLVGPLTPGSVFQWRSGRHTIISILEQVEPPRRIAWRGRTFGITACHRYTLLPEPTGTRVASAETWEGLVVRLLRGRLQRQLQAALDDGLQALQAAVAGRTA
jgi:uncharacterized protein YndB with AHSA1/START domain